MSGQRVAVTVFEDGPYGRAVWLADDGTVDVETIAYIHADGTTFVPADRQADVGEYHVDGRCVSSWVELGTGVPAILVDGVPYLAVFDGVS